ncbi:hypothetical protein Dtox_2595 [Desulfofarcimen acetoxidans DSM 771]|jgi:hypothetical protein|uniref:Uncharacterized protein n=1 Tax=Desulfofarcimen acetoxidans (strain ATCC 49208 / DSM 771 / KCTC 5769 / VKM B-1644 / 5575) TaxID=485916 RepID=C8W0Z2_DESAS|nr:hypothetical protein [Desulfofarcimen acetoxidans]ACV63388.1 hypothetical protein Dtox_2595 [Desulfofarcimen acetoxidans DSM 771]
MAEKHEVKEEHKKNVKKEKSHKKIKDFKRKDFIEDEKISIVSDVQNFNAKNIKGTHLVGFVDVEKIFRISKEKIFLEKKLPFSILILQFNEHKY